MWEDDPDLDVIDDAMPSCPKCLVRLDAEGDGNVFVWLECPVCGDLFL